MQVLNLSPMRKIRIEKVTLNIGAGVNAEKLEKGLKLLKAITNTEAVKTYTNKRIPTWNLRPGLPIGCKLTLRKKRANELLRQLLKAKNNKLMAKQFDNDGNFAFGIHEYIDIPEVRYDPDIGIMGLEVCVTLERPGYRVKNRKIMPRKIPPRHKITRQEAVQFIKEAYGVEVVEE